MATWYEIHCDETHVHNRPRFAKGGIKVSPGRASRFAARLRAFKEQRRIDHELKWNKVNARFFDVYRGFVDQLIQESAPTCHVLRVTKGHKWTLFGRNEEERFFKSYYVFFRIFARFSYRHGSCPG